MLENEITAIQLQAKQQQIQSVIRQADAMSLSLLFSLGRQYLEVPFGETLWDINVSTGETPHFLQLEQVGDPQSGSPQQPLTALQTALSACHAPNKYSFIFLVTSDGNSNRIYFGVRGHNATTTAPVFVDNLRNFLQGNWPGTRLRNCKSESTSILYSLKGMDYAVALTGIPSLKQGDQQGYPQTLDRLIRGMQGKKFAYVVIAEPMDKTDVNGIIYQCRSLLGNVHSLVKFTETATQGINYSSSTSMGNTKGTNTADADLTTSLLIGVQGLTSRFPPIGFLTALGSVGLPILSSKLGWQQTMSDSETKTFNETIGTNLSLATGKEQINAHAQAAEAHLQRYISRFEQALALGCWNVGVYFLAKDSDIAQQGGTQLGALLSGEKSSFEAIRIHDLHEASTKGVQVALSNLSQPNIKLSHSHPLGDAFSGLTTPLSTEELALLVNLPRREIPGVSVMPSASFSLNPPKIIDKDAIELGTVLDGSEPTSLKYKLSLKTFTKHALVTGINGSGKSTTCWRLLMEMLRHKVPFLVIEPAKAEYVELAMAHNEKLSDDDPNSIAIYMPGVKKWRDKELKSELVLNPLDVVWLENHTPQILPHIDRLKSVLNASFPMQEVLPVLLEELIYYTYGSPHNWLDDTLPAFGTALPTLTNLINNIPTVIKKRGYGADITDNLAAALTTRIQSLRRGWKSKLFNQARSTPWHELFDRPAVINISNLGDDADKSFAMSIILQFLYEYRQAQHETLSSEAESGNLKHLMVIEEAHRIMLRTGQGSMEQANPQAKAAEMFSNILSEIRAYGQGLLIVDQVPSRLIPDAIKNTNLKIVHRLVASDDRNSMGECMCLTPEQALIINRLRPGQAIVYGDMDDAAAWLQVQK